MNLLIRYIFLLCLINCHAQTDSVWQQKPKIQTSGLVDVFYVYDFNKPTTNFRQSFLYNHNRHNEFNLNLGILKVAIDHPKYRSNLAFHSGTYVNDNYIEEQGLMKMLSEANVGISVSKKNKLWIDAGIFASHIGFESAISIDNWTMTRSLLAENSPYFLSGLKSTYKPNDKWEFTGIICNGWQRIKRLEGNSLLSFGSQIVYNKKEKIKLNWSTFIGTDDPDSTRRIRIFNNVYGQFQLAKKIGLIAGFDFGLQQNSKFSSKYESWYSPVLIAQYSFTDHWKASVRAEYYFDNLGVIIPTGTPNGFQVSGLSLNLDYFPNKNIVCRIEGRVFKSRDSIFQMPNAMTHNNIFIGTSFCVKIGK